MHCLFFCEVEQIKPFQGMCYSTSTCYSLIASTPFHTATHLQSHLYKLRNLPMQNATFFHSKHDPPIGEAWWPQIWQGSSCMRLTSSLRGSGWLKEAVTSSRCERTPCSKHLQTRITSQAWMPCLGFQRSEEEALLTLTGPLTGSPLWEALGIPIAAVLLKSMPWLELRILRNIVSHSNYRGKRHQRIRYSWLGLPKNFSAGWKHMNTMISSAAQEATNDQARVAAL